MTPLVAILTVAALVAPEAARGASRPEPPPADRILLPPATGLEMRFDAIEATLTFTARTGLRPVARALRATSRSLCRRVEVGSAEVTLRCATNRIDARLRAGRSPGSRVLELRSIQGLPWAGEPAVPPASFDPTAIGLDDLRAGDLARGEGDARRAEASWSRVAQGPLRRLAAARLCELGPCIDGPTADDLYDTTGLPGAVALDLRLRAARSMALRGRAMEAVRLLHASRQANGAWPEEAFCRRILLAALTGPEGGEALGVWLEMPDRDTGPLGLELSLAAAGAAERAGAPLFGANLLAAAAGRVPRTALPDHLLRTAELFLGAGDRVRAGVVVEFARTRAGAKKLRGPRWSAVSSALASGARRPATPEGTARPDAADDEGLARGGEAIAAATRAASRARALAEVRP